MRTLKIALLATVAAAALSSATLAADLIIADPVIDNATAFDWEGPYAGVWLAGHDLGIFGLGVDLGVNVLASEGVLLGVEGELGWLSDDTWIGQVHGRAGFLVSDEFLIYGLAGVGIDADWGGFIPVGVGAEFAVADNLTLKAQYQYQWDFDSAAEDAHVVKFGLNWHF